MAQRVLETNVEQGGYLGRIVERDDGTKVFLRGRKIDRGGDGGDGGDRGFAEGERRADELLAQQRAQSEALLRRQREEEERQFQAAKGRSEQALGQFRKTIGGLEAPGDVSKRIQEELGIPDIRESTKGLRQQIATAEGQFKELPGAVRESLRGALVTEGQRQRLIAKESIPITEQLQVLSRTLGVESANLSEALSSAITQTQFTIQGQERLLEPERLNIQQVAQLNQQRLAMFSEAAARELTAFNSQREAELGVLAQKLQNDRTLSDQEFQRAIQLAASERDFEQMKEQLRLQSQLNMDETRLTQGLLSARELALQLTGAGQKKELVELEATIPSTLTERGAEKLAPFLQGVLDVFGMNSGVDGFVVAQKYREERARLAAKGVTGKQFDEQFSNYLSPEEKINLGIGKTTNIGQLGGDEGDSISAILGIGE